VNNLISVRLGPTSGEDLTRIRGRSCSWSSVDHTPAFELSIPLKFHSSPVQFTSRDIPSLRFETREEDREIQINNVAPSEVTTQRLLQGGEIATGVDALSRSIVHQPASEAALIRRLSDHPEVSATSLDAVREKMITPLLADQFSQPQITEARDLLARNTRNHETQHIKDLINPETALWREIELYWQLQLIAASPETLDNETIVNRVAALYATPRQFLTEISALATETFDSPETEIEEFLFQRITAQRGPEYRLLQFLKQHSIGRQQLASIIDSDVAEQFGDFWLLYVIEQLQQGSSPDEINSTDFLDEVGARDPGSYIGLESEPDTELSALRDDFTEFVYAHLYGPAFEVISLDTDGERFILRRQWYNINPSVENDGTLLAIRRALFLRALLSAFRSKTELTRVRKTVHQTIVRALAGHSVSLSPPLIEATPERVAHTLRECLEIASEQLLKTSDRAAIDRWLNDPDYDPLNQF